MRRIATLRIRVSFGEYYTLVAFDALSVEQGVYSIYYIGTLLLPEGRGEVVDGGGERRSVRVLNF